MSDGFVALVLLIAAGVSGAMIVGFFQAVGLLREISGKLDRLAPAARWDASAPAQDAAVDLPGPGTSRPGWYADPQDGTMERRWTGTAWADDAPRPVRTGVRRRLG